MGIKKTKTKITPGRIVELLCVTILAIGISFSDIADTWKLTYMLLLLIYAKLLVVHS